MKFIPGCWTHKNFRDVFIYVVRSEEETESGVVLVVEWFHNNGQSLGVADTILIKPEQYENWSWRPYPDEL